MSMWGKMIGGIAGFAVGGPFGAVMGAALGHAADSGSLPGQAGFSLGIDPSSLRLQQTKAAAMLGQRDHVFAISVVVLAAKLAKCDGVVSRAEIDAFKRHFRVPPGSAHEIGRMFDQARDGTDGFEPYARQLGTSFADRPEALEDVMAALFAIGRADGKLTAPEQDFLRRTHAAFNLDRGAWERASGAAPRSSQGTRPQAPGEPDAYSVLGLTRAASDETLHQTWRQLMRDNHPDSLASRGAAPEVIARASERVAGINAAWDRIKRERSL